ncbi:flagellar biosynthesis protein [Inhella gelatinilytica]|uniref:Flagellar biosynthesis protein n=1 Tax=Inhella gelatinilytica TaxID=2795030 RepID=A0A931NAR6_9BURK|nr:flagellar biosynthesis protein [Inhella gelatinilytica]MBH9552768.1 flagellar biosynthesis protein [Inhella gelatinilytica]
MAQLHTDQAAGLRRLFRAAEGGLVPVVAPSTWDGAETLLDALVGAYLERGLHVLVVDASAAAKPASELVRVRLEACIEPLSADVNYLEARGLIGHFLDATGAASALLPALRQACPQADVILLFAPVAELARVLTGGHPCRPIVMVDLQPEHLTEAYSAMKWLQQRAGCGVFGLLVAGPARLALVRRMVEQLTHCAERFLGAALPAWAAVDPKEGVKATPSAELRRLARDSLQIEPQNRHHARLEPVPVLT